MTKESKKDNFIKPRAGQEDAIDLLKLAQVFLRHWWAIMICLMIGAGTAGFLESVTFVPKYTSNALIYVNINKVSLGNTNVTLGDFSNSVALGNRYTVAINSRRVLEKAIKEHNLEHSYNELKRMVSVSAVNETEFLSVSVTSVDPLDASQVANAVTESLIEVMNTLVEGNNARILDSAQIPETSSGPNYQKKALMGGVLGAAACCGVLTLMFLLDNTVKDREELTENYAHPVLTVVPDHTVSRKDTSYGYGKQKHGRTAVKKGVFFGWDSMSFAGQEAYKLLRTNVEFSFPKTENETVRGKIVGITSSVPNEYKSTTSVNLALALAEEQRRVLLLDCDLRKSELRGWLGVKEKKGLSDYLIGDAKLEEVIQRGVPGERPDVLLCGTYPPNPSELLASRAMTELAAFLKKHYDYILVDLPPVSEVTDALVAGRFCDGMLMVVREKYTTKKVLNECFRQMEYASMPLIGIALTGDDISSSGYRKYGYGYGYGYGYSNRKHKKD